MSATTEELWKEAAGPLYEEFLTSKQATFNHIDHPVAMIRCAAIHFYESQWNGAKDPAFVELLQSLAAANSYQILESHTCFPELKCKQTKLPFECVIWATAFNMDTTALCSRAIVFGAK